MARIAGLAFLKLNGAALPVKANCVVSPDAVERAMIPGQDYVHGFSENPRVPYVQADISLTPDIDMETIAEGVDETIIVEFANGQVWTLQGACYKGASELQTKDGQVQCRWEGTTCTRTA
jgi:hypothetical protein